jgi:RNA polymerase sigma factor (sigma-70 family)
MRERVRSVAIENETTLVLLASLVDRLKGGDPTVRDEMIRISYRRLDAMVRRMLKRDDRIGGWEEPDDVLQNAAIRLWRALEQVTPSNVDEFLGLAATQIRRELLDLARHYFGPQGQGSNQVGSGLDGGVDGTPGPRFEGVETTYDPTRLATWTEFHRAVEALPADERSLCEMLWYLGLPQEEVAKALKVDISTVKRRWRGVRLKLHRVVKDWDGVD